MLSDFKFPSLASHAPFDLSTHGELVVFFCQIIEKLDHLLGSEVLVVVLDILGHKIVQILRPGSALL